MLKLQNLSVSYPDKTKAIDNLCLSVSDGETLALLGENGAGKTTLFHAIVGILDKTDGHIEVDGVSLSKATIAEIRKRVGLVFQNPDDQLFMPLIYDDVAFGCRNHGLNREETDRKVKETLKILNISHLINRSPLKLSGGEKRMAAIATVLVMEPSIIMFDEPTAFLDPKARRGLIETLNRLKYTKIIATHDMDFAAAVCKRVVVLKNGRIAAYGGAELLRSKEIMTSCGLEALEHPQA